MRDHNAGAPSRRSCVHSRATERLYMFEGPANEIVGSLKSQKHSHYLQLKRIQCSWTRHESIAPATSRSIHCQQIHMVLFSKVFSSVGCQIEDGRSRFLKAYLLRNEICSNHLYLRTFISSKIDNIAQHTQFTLDEIPISGTVFHVGIHNNVPLKKGISLRTCSSKSIFWSLKLEACLSACLLPYKS